MSASHCIIVAKQIENVFKMLQLKANEKRINFILNIEDDVPEFVNSDPIRIKQILINLLNNAIKFTDEGSVELVVSVKKIIKNNVELRFKIIDTGVGIPKNKIGNMFTEFTQAYSSTTRKYGGTGLGLTISKRLAELMNGKIGFESEYGLGSTFWFTVNADVCSKPIEQSSDNNDVTILPDNIKILLAEDNLINQKVSLLMIKQIGYDCDIAENGEEAYNMHINNNYDIIFMDILMPVMDGMRATNKIRSWENDNNVSKKCVIVAQTANAFKEDVDAYLGGGMDFYVSKPLKISDLKSVLVQVYS